VEDAPDVDLVGGLDVEHGEGESGETDVAEAGDVEVVREPERAGVRGCG
jgi:hypothetical protein